MATKKRDLISLTFPAFTRGIPQRLNLREHSVAFPQAEEMAGHTGLISGVYGAHSKQMALVLSSKWHAEHRDAPSGPNLVLQVDTGYRIDNFTETKTLITEESLAATGWLHLDRLSAEVREGLKEEWLGWIYKDFGGPRAARLADTPLSEIAMQYPIYVGKLMAKRTTRLTAVVHPVHPAIDPTAVLWVATVRYEPERFEDTVVRFLPACKVDL